MARRLLFFALGLLFGAAVGSAMALLLTPASGGELRKQAQRRVRNAAREAKKAARERRHELERQLDALTRTPAKK